MDHTSDMEQDVVADSEGEDDLQQLKPLSPAIRVYNSPLRISPLLVNTSTVSEFSLAPYKKDAISAFTETPGTTRPKAKPQSSDSIQPTSAMTANDHILGIADRAKMRSRTKAKPKPQTDIIDISSSDENELPKHSLGIPKDSYSASNLRPKPRPLAKVSDNSISGTASSHSSRLPAAPALNPNTSDTTHLQLRRPSIAALPEPNTSSIPAPVKKRRRTSDDDSFAWSSDLEKPVKKRALKKQKNGEVGASKPKIKTKPKEKTPGGKATAKKQEIFKSREFIEDDEQVDELLRDAVISLNPIQPTAKEIANHTKTPDDFKSREFIEESDGEDGGPPSPAGALTSSTKDDLLDDDQLAIVNTVAVSSAKETKKRDALEDGEKLSKKKKISTKQPLGKGKALVVLSDQEDDLPEQVAPAAQEPPLPKENVHPVPAASGAKSSRYSIGPRTKSTPMSELIRRVNSLPSSPFSTAAVTGGTAYSPYLKSSKSALSRIAPLHPNRRPPPAPLPPPPPRQKTKKEKEMEELWEEELIETVGGMTEWVSMSDIERKDMRRAKRDREMGGWEE